VSALRRYRLGYYLGAAQILMFLQISFLRGREYFWAEPSLGGVDVKIDGINLTANIGYRF